MSIVANHRGMASALLFRRQRLAGSGPFLGLSFFGCICRPAAAAYFKHWAISPVLLHPSIGIASSLLALAAQAQTLPPPTRDVYRCEVAGNVSYSDVPCLGAKKVDVEPTRGLNASSGRERIGRDVQRERFNEQVAEAIRPLTGKSAKQLDAQTKRIKLPASAQRECRQLDQAIPATEARERSSSGTELRTVQQELLVQRHRYRLLRC